MPELPSVYPPLDLTRYSEHAQREIYARVVAIQFAPLLVGNDWTLPAYSPDDAGLMVFYIFGRWFAVWMNMEEPEDVPLSRRIELVRVQAAPDKPEGIMLYEV